MNYSSLLLKYINYTCIQIVTNLYFVAATVSFEQLSYTVNEADGRVEPVLVLSNPSSSVITVQVFSIDGSATGKQLTISCTIIE